MGGFPPQICLRPFFFYRYYHGFGSKEIKSIIPLKASFVRNTRFSRTQHPHALKLDTNRTNAFANSFIPMTSIDWNSLPLTVFSATYNLQSFKIHIHEHHPIPKSLLISKIQGSTTDYRGATSYCISIIIKQKLDVPVIILLMKIERIYRSQTNI